MLAINPAPPTWMHIDLNSCFASIEQQSNPFLRGKPLVIAARDSETGCIVAASYEAKALGIKTGMRIFEARRIHPHFYIRSPDSAKYRDIHVRFMNLLQHFSPTVIPKSIDEAILNFNHIKSPTPQHLTSISQHIKSQMKTQLGSYITASIGLGPNRFLAKVAANLQKPNGLQVINSSNLETTLGRLQLTDLPGIAHANAARLKFWGITNPLEFLKAPPRLLQKQVFGSINGHYWHLKLHGYDLNEEPTGTKSIGHQYVLHHRTADPQLLLPILYKMTERVGRRLRKSQFATQHLHLFLRYDNHTKFYQHIHTPTPISITHDLYQIFKQLFQRQPSSSIITQIALTTTNLISTQTNQLTLFDSNSKHTALAQAADRLNDRYGEFLVQPALMMGTKHDAPDRIGFGRVKDIPNLYP